MPDAHAGDAHAGGHDEHKKSSGLEGILNGWSLVGGGLGAYVGYKAMYAGMTDYLSSYLVGGLASTVGTISSIAVGGLVGGLLCYGLYKGIKSVFGGKKKHAEHKDEHPGAGGGNVAPGGH